MWKKSWNKLKTVLGTPEEYIEEETEAEEAQEEEASAPEYCLDPVVPISRQDLEPLYKTMESIKTLKVLGGEMLLRHESERAEFVRINNKLNEQQQKQIDDLRTIYNVEPTVDYALNFPMGEEEEGSLVRQEPASES